MPAQADVWRRQEGLEIILQTFDHILLPGHQHLHQYAAERLIIAADLLFGLAPALFDDKQDAPVAAGRRLPHLADVGVTSVEVMPVAEFPGFWKKDPVATRAISSTTGRK